MLPPRPAVSGVLSSAVRTIAPAVVVLLVLSGRGDAGSPLDKPFPIAPDALKAAADRSAAYLMSQARADGSFVYRINLDPRLSARPQYNWLRHAGAIYALADYYRETQRADIVPVISPKAGKARPRFRPITGP